MILVEKVTGGNSGKDFEKVKKVNDLITEIRRETEWAMPSVNISVGETVTITNKTKILETADKAIKKLLELQEVLTENKNPTE